MLEMPKFLRPRKDILEPLSLYHRENGTFPIGTVALFSKSLGSHYPLFQPSMFSLPSPTQPIYLHPFSFYLFHLKLYIFLPCAFFHKTTNGTVCNVTKLAY
jgi:hypothetical protein